MLEVLLDRLWKERPRHPPFADGASDPANGAEVLMALCQQADPELWRSAREPWQSRSECECGGSRSQDDGQLTFEQGLIRNQEWIDCVSRAVELDTFDLRLNRSNFVPDWNQGDPRRELYHFTLRTSDILVADSQRLCLAGDTSLACRRADAIVRLAEQLARNESTVHHHLHANSLARRAIWVASLLLKRVAATSTRRAIGLLHDAVQRVSPCDPQGLRTAWGRSFREAASLIDDQTHGNRIGRLLYGLIAMEMLVDGRLRVVPDGFLDGRLGDLGPSEVCAAIAAGLLPRESELLSLTAEVLLAARSRALNLGEHLERGWASPAGEQVARAASSEVRNDPTTMLRIVLGAPERIWNVWQQTTWERQSFLRACEASLE